MSRARQQRRALDRKTDRLLETIAWSRLPDDLDCDRHVGLLHGAAPMLVASREAVRVAIGSLGFADVLDEIARHDRPAGRLPVIAVVPDADGTPFASVAYVPVVRTTQGAA